MTAAELLAGLLPIYGTLLLAGIAGSLHCLGMCGPLLIAFAQAQRSGLHDPRSHPVLDFVGYHSGRVWTYAMLGLGAGFVGDGLRRGAAAIGWQRPIAYALGVVVLASGIALLGLVPGVRLDRLGVGCTVDRVRRRLGSLVAHPGILSRLLLGAVMGLLPCGLVYAMLGLVATLPHPALSALGMVAFGVGTLPALSGALLLGRVVPAWARAHATRVTAIALLLAGSWMLVRTAVIDPVDGDRAAHCARPATQVD